MKRNRYTYTITHLSDPSEWSQEGISRDVMGSHKATSIKQVQQICKDNYEIPFPDHYSKVDPIYWVPGSVDQQLVITRTLTTAP